DGLAEQLIRGRVLTLRGAVLLRFGLADEQPKRERDVCVRGQHDVASNLTTQPVLVSVTSSPTAPRSADQGSCVPCLVRRAPHAALDTAKQHDELASLHGSGGAT